MNGFITESTSKISDGLGNTVKLLLLYAFTSLIIIPIEKYFHRAGLLVYIFLLIAIAVFELQRSLAARTSDQRRAWDGMAAGLYFWQVIRYTSDLGSFFLFQQSGLIFWVMVALMTATLWNKVIPVGVRSCMLVILVNWLGKLYLAGFSYVSEWPPVIVFSYSALRYLAGAVGLLALFYILFRSQGVSSQSYGAIIVFASVLFLLLAF